MPDLSDMRVLVVDDVESNIDILLDMLGDDYRVSVAMDGESALEEVALLLPDLILLDIVMPEMDGYDVCRRLKSDPKTRNIPVIFLTSLSEAGDAAKGLALGAEDYITKPFNKDLVKSRVHNHLTIKRDQAKLTKMMEKHQQEDEHSQHEKAAISMENETATPPTIMIVDDIESDIDILMECLSDQYRVTVALDGETALKAIETDLPDLILLDILMPGMDGYDVCLKLKQNPTTKDIPILFVTALSEAIDETRGFELGAVDYITKPFNFYVIRARIKTHLALANAQKELELKNDILKENIRLREQVEQVTRHDLKNPLQVIMGMADMLTLGLETDSPKSEMLEMIEKQQKSCDTVLHIINCSMTLYKMEKGTYKLDLKPTNIMPVLDRVLLGVKHLIETGEIDITVQINGRLRHPDDTLELTCEECLFYSMMSNLVKNALEASPIGARVSIHFDKSGATRGTTLSIENHGAVNLEIRQNFFEKFITSGKRQGTGLGTYSARLIAEIHGADIQMSTSDETETTRITIEWPPPRDFHD